ncbi:MAG: glycosyltransferase [Thermoleophilia bacterium]|nr:glycosyltransferase [Thermoleophilia bacterium]
MRRPLRLLWIGTYERDYPRGRILRAALTIAGHDVIERHVPVWEGTRHKAGGFLRSPALLRSGARFARGWGSLAAAQRRVGAIDAVVAGYPAQPDVVPARLVARAHGVPLVVDMMVGLGDTLSGDRGRAGSSVGRLLAGIDRAAVRLADVVIADTAANGAWLSGALEADPARVVVIPVSAEVAAFPRSEAPDPPARAVFVGKLAPLHGLGVVMRAARFPGAPPLHVVGTGQLDAWLAESLRRDGAPAGFQHTPWVPYDELGALLADHHIVLGVFGGSDKTARVVPNKVWQAMAVGRPIVTRDTRGIREVLTHERDALLVPPGDSGALAAALARLASDAPLRQRLGAAAHARFLECSVAEGVRRLTDLISAIRVREVS